jgi:AbrB family looped-hinge helix DNA binding protein
MMKLRRWTRSTLSTKGQLILPKAIRQQRRWEAGTRLIIEDTPGGVLVREAPHFAATAPEDVYASLARPAAPKSIEEMDAAIVKESRRRHARH